VSEDTKRKIAVAKFGFLKAFKSSRKNGFRVKDTDKGMRRLFERWERESGFEVLAGVVGPRAKAGKIIPEDGSRADLNVAQVATVLEFGSSKVRIPSRPFLRAPFDANQRKYHNVLRSSEEPKQGLFLAAEAYVADVVEDIQADKYRPLSSFTVMKREERTGVADTLPLVDTGQLLQTIGTRIKSNTRYLK
jgi:hypothetical protein